MGVLFKRYGAVCRRGFMAVMAFAALASQDGMAEKAVDISSLPDSITSRRAFLELPVQNLDIIPRSARLDMLEYLDADSVYQARNSMEGLSELVPPVTKDYLMVRITPVSTISFKVLPLKKGGQIVVTSYTVGSDLRSADSEVCFFDAAMQPLKRQKFLKPAEVKDFLRLENVDKATSRRLLELIPFPTVEYTLSPDSTSIEATLTVRKAMGKEDYAEVEPYLRPHRVFIWNGTEFRLEK